jgi:Rrf2 family iron-sulfur cluster assembly transcriptional regulator
VECVSSPEKCELAADCLVRNAWQDATSVLYEKLDGISIADLIHNNGKNNPAACPSL